METPPRQDVFPATRRTWLLREMSQGGDGLALARGHVMETYAWPLSVYYRGSSFRTLGEADEVVHAFLADRLSRPAFLQDWADSGRPLRYWLITGFKHSLQERRRRERRDAHAALPEDSPEPAADGAERVFAREAARSVVARAAEAAADACAAAGLGEHWDIFRRHALGGAAYAAIAADLGVDERRARVMSRTAANKFRAALRQAIGWPGASDEDIEADIAALLEDLR